MGKRKEFGKEGLNNLIEKSNDAFDKGEEMNFQANEINKILDTINVQDDDDIAAINETEKNYSSNFNESFAEQVSEKGVEVNLDADIVTNEMSSDLQGVKAGISGLEKASSVSDIGTQSAEHGKSKLESSSTEYENIIDKTHSVTENTNEKISKLKSDLDSIFE